MSNNSDIKLASLFDFFKNLNSTEPYDGNDCPLLLPIYVKRFKHDS